VAPYLGRICRDGGTHEARMVERQPGEAIPVSATLAKTADPAVLRPRLVALGAHDVQMLDDRGLGGALRAQFTAADEQILAAIVALDEVEWVEPPGCINLDG
jgi:hypothetical protein